MLLNRCPDSFLNSPRGRAEYDIASSMLANYYNINPARWQAAYLNQLTQHARICYLQGEYEYGYEQYIKILDIITERYSSNPTDYKIRRCNIQSRLIFDLFEHSHNYALCIEWCKKQKESLEAARSVFSEVEYNDFCRRLYTIQTLAANKLESNL